MARRKRRKNRRWVTFERCFLFTAGAVFIALALAVWISDEANRSSWPTWGYAFLLLFVGYGSTLIVVGLTSSSKNAEWWASVSSTHHASLLLALLAAPLYFILRRVERSWRARRKP